MRAVTEQERRERLEELRERFLQLREENARGRIRSARVIADLDRLIERLRAAR